MKKRGFRNQFRNQDLDWKTINRWLGKGIDAAMVELLLKEMENLKIAMVKKSDDHPTSSKYMDRRCICCDSTEYDQRDCDEQKEELR